MLLYGVTAAKDVRVIVSGLPGPLKRALTMPSNCRLLEAMRPILSIQSHVVYGHVGNDAAAFPLQRLGREVWPLMSVQFSSHTGYPGWRGRAFDAGMIDECVAGLEAIGALTGCGGLLTGYLGKAEIGEAALRALSALRAANSDAAWCCDPVIGDVGRGLYVAPEVAEFFRSRALPAATILTPNAFELEWLTGSRVRTLDEARTAVAAVLARGPRVVAVTSVVLDDTPRDALDVLAGDNSGLWRARTPRLPIAVNGGGDLFAALFFHHRLDGGSTPAALSKAVSSVFGVVSATFAMGRRELALIDAQEEFLRPSQVISAERI
jgi:pyridoxine kinase